MNRVRGAGYPRQPVNVDRFRKVVLALKMNPVLTFQVFEIHFRRV